MKQSFVALMAALMAILVPVGCDTDKEGTEEVCDGIDNDGDGSIDIGAVDATIWYQDCDGDGLGVAGENEDCDGDGYPDDAGDGTPACEAPEGYVDNNQDCDDLDSAIGTDADRDGYCGDDDCDNDNAAINPDADELCNDVDDDCDGEIDEEAVDDTTWYADADGDGFGNDEDRISSCTQPEGYVDNDDDCFDGDSGQWSNPTGEEIADGLDNDCDGIIDDGTEYGDDDNDGYSEIDGDCDDNDADINPDAEEIWYDDVDQNCDSGSDYDQDGDGYDSIEVDGGTDCIDGSDRDDDNPADLEPFDVNPGATENWYDGTDRDCAGDDDYDQDGDGYQAEGYGVGSNDDCDDTVARTSPGADEVCSTSADDDCDDEANEGCAVEDADGDGYTNMEDCDDTEEGIYPDADEYCDEIDNDCDGFIDEDDAVDVVIWYADEDSDNYGDPDSTVFACSAPDDYVDNSDDCDDSDEDISPEAVEECEDGIDQDCDGEDDECGTGDDLDGDGYDDGEDCDDTDAAINPGATEISGDEIDQNCDDKETCYRNEDGDGYRGTSTVISTDTDCDDVGEATRGMTSGDCDDGDADKYPGAREICDDKDNDCNGSVDDDAADASTWYTDADGDDYGVATGTTEACDRPDGYADNTEDCDDAKSAVHPGATDDCEDDIDQDCDGEDEVCDDFDGDGYDNIEDCDDEDDGVYPGADEYCNGEDDDCDGEIDVDAVDAIIYYVDLDGDGYGDPGKSTDALCDDPGAPYVDNGLDCDDHDASVGACDAELMLPLKPASRWLVTAETCAV